jgi:hypothetical protein
MIAGITAMNIFIDDSGGVAPSGVRWNSADKGGSITLSNGDLTASNATSDESYVRATTAKTTGKWYWEITVDVMAAAGDCFIGIVVPGTSTTIRVVNAINQPRCMFRSDGTRYDGSVTANGGPSYTVGDVVMFAWDATADKFWAGKNGTWHGSGDPAAGTGQQSSGFASGGAVAPAFGPDNSPGTTTVTANFGPTFAYTIPAGFTVLT